MTDFASQWEHIKTRAERVRAEGYDIVVARVEAYCAVYGWDFVAGNRMYLLTRREDGAYVMTGDNLIDPGRLHRAGVQGQLYTKKPKKPYELLWEDEEQTIPQMSCPEIIELIKDINTADFWQ